jgi:hypothetical protein
MIAPAHLKRGIRGKRLPCLVDLFLAAEHEARKDQRLRPRPALDQATLHKELIDARLRHLSFSPRPARPASRG